MRNCVGTVFIIQTNHSKKEFFFGFFSSFSGGIDELILKRSLPNVPHLCTFFISELRICRYFVLGSVFSLAFWIRIPIKAYRGLKKFMLESLGTFGPRGFPY
jgi:hypothetical protein